MAKKGKTVGPKPKYNFVYKSKFEALINAGKEQHQTPLGNTFLGFKLNNHNELWDWRTLEYVKFD